MVHIHTWILPLMHREISPTNLVPTIQETIQMDPSLTFPKEKSKQEDRAQGVSRKSLPCTERNHIRGGN